MNPDSLVKILTFFNKPFHYLIAGIIILVFAEKEWTIGGWLLIGLSIASFVEWLVNICKEKINQQQKIKIEQEEKIREKENLYKAYDKLNWEEKVVIFTSVVENEIVYMGAEDIILALHVKGFGQRDGFTKFVLKPKYLRWLSEYEQVLKDYDFYYDSEEDDDGNEEEQ